MAPQTDTRTRQRSTTRQHSTTGHNTEEQGATTSRPTTGKHTRTHTGKEGPYQDRRLLCPFRLSPLLTCS